MQYNCLSCLNVLLCLLNIWLCDIQCDYLNCWHSFIADILFVKYIINLDEEIWKLCSLCLCNGHKRVCERHDMTMNHKKWECKADDIGHRLIWRCAINATDRIKWSWIWIFGIEMFRVWTHNLMICYQYNGQDKMIMDLNIWDRDV